MGWKFTDLGFLKWVEDWEGEKNWSLLTSAITVYEWMRERERKTAVFWCGVVEFGELEEAKWLSGLWEGHVFWELLGLVYGFWGGSISYTLSQSSFGEKANECFKGCFLRLHVRCWLGYFISKLFIFSTGPFPIILTFQNLCKKIHMSLTNSMVILNSVSIR